MNYKIKKVIDAFCHKCNYEENQGNDLPKLENVTSVISDVLIEQSKAGRKVTLEQTLKYIDDSPCSHLLYRVRKRYKSQLNEIKKKLEISDDDFINEEITGFEEQQEQERLKYTDNYLDTAFDMWEPYVFGVEKVWEHMEEKRDSMGLEQKYKLSTLGQYLKEMRNS